MIKFRCPRCNELSAGRRYHEACFAALYTEDQILKEATAAQRAAADTKILSRSTADERRAAVARGLSPRSAFELDRAEASWTRLIDGRSF